MSSSLSAASAACASIADRHTAILVIVLVSYLMIVIDISIVLTGLPNIRRDLDFSAAGLSWVQSAYTLAFGGLLLLGARAGDILAGAACSSPASRSSPLRRSRWARRSRPPG